MWKQQQLQLFTNTFRSQFTLTASQTGAKLKQMPKEIGSSESEDNAEYGEMTFAEHFDESSQDPPLIEGERCSTKFQRDPKKYLEDKLMSGLFKKVWTTVVPRNLQAPVSVLAEDIITEENRSQRHMQDNGQRFSSIEEDMVMSSSGFDQQRLFSQREAAKRNVSPPLSDLNPISLPDLTSRPVSNFLKKSYLKSILLCFHLVNAIEISLFVVSGQCSASTNKTTWKIAVSILGQS